MFCAANLSATSAAEG